MKELFTALSKAQAKVENAIKGNTNPAFRSKYADLASVWDAIREPFTSEGLSIVQFITDGVDGKATIRTVLAHSSGEMLEDTFSIPVTKADAQGFGSAITYGRRYSLMAVAGIAPEDDDGNAASGKAVAAPKPTVDYSGTIAEAKALLKASKTLDEAKALVAQIGRSNIPDPARSELVEELKAMAKGLFPKADK